MNTINFVIRSRMGDAQRGVVSTEPEAGRISAGSGNEISLNLSQDQLRGYDRVGTDLHITLADGTIVVLEGYFNEDGSAANRLFLSYDGILNEVSFADGGGSVLFATYGPTEEWGKWSPSDDLIFYDRPQVAEVTQEVVAESENDVSMLAAGLLGGSSLLGAAGAGAAALGAATLLGAAGDNGGSGGGSSPIRTVDGGSVTLGGDDLADVDKVITVSGTGAEGDVVDVTIGDKTGSATVDETGEWEVVFEGENFPEDGTYETEVEFTGTDGEAVDKTGPTVVIDTTPPDLTVDGGTQASGEIFNAVEYEDGMTISGSVEPGATVVVTIMGVSHTVTGSAEGTWSVTYTSSELEGGEYEAPITVVASDSFGNTTTVTEVIQIDTIPHPITFDSVTTDNVVSDGEASGSVTITGSSTPGAVLTVTVEGFSQQVTAGSNGSWSLSVPAGTFAAGDYASSVTATTVDAAGNASSASHDFRVDTVTNVTVETDTVETDGVVNKVERADGIELTGTTDPGSTVMVTVAGVSHAATVAANGTWSVAFAASELPTGNGVPVAVTAVATDEYGNEARAAGSLNIDTLVDPLSSTAAIAGDNIVNADEAAAGFTVKGVVEAGSTVVVTFNGIGHVANVGASGNWTVDIPAASIPAGTDDRLIKIDATDAAGNTDTISRTILVDTEAPDAPVIEGYYREAEGYFYVTTETTADAVDIHEVNGDGSVTELAINNAEDPFLPRTVHQFADGPVEDGSSLVVSRTDEAGNTAGTFLVFDESATSEVDLGNANLAEFNIEIVDLELAEDSELTITEEQLLALSSNNNGLTVYGGVDDMVTITGATLTGTTSDDNGHTLNVYSLGDDGTVLIDDDITNVVI